MDTSGQVVSYIQDRFIPCVQAEIKANDSHLLNVVEVAKILPVTSIFLRTCIVVMPITRGE